MKNKKLKGFSLAELLISLLIISIVLSAAIPTLTKRAGAGREFIWRWSQQQNNNAYFGVGSNQSAIIGADAIPLKGSGLDKILVDDEVNIANLRFSNNGDKLVLIKKSTDFDELGDSDFANSHISFYTASNSKEDATTSDITYAGRIATSKHDLAFGIGTLQSLTEAETKNTAIGHYALLKNTQGVENTAVGEKALSFNIVGNKNTAVGYKSLFFEGFAKGENNTGSATEAGSNTAMGHESVPALQAGSSNSALGAEALYALAKGNDNVVVGFEGLNGATEGSGNVVVGSQACSFITKGNNNICIGYRSGASSKKDSSGNPKPEPSDYGIFIGSSDSSMPIISGHSQKVDTTDNKYEKELNINARIFKILPHNGGTAIMRVDSLAANNDKVFSFNAGQGYGEGTGGYMGLVSFNLLQGGEDTTTLFFRGFRDAIYNESNKRIVLGTADMNPVSGAQNGIIDLSFNDKLALVFNNNNCSGHVCINTVGGDSENKNTNLGLNNKLFINYDTNTPKVDIVPNSINVNSGNKNYYSVNFNSPSTNGNIQFSLNDSYKDSVNNVSNVPILYVRNGKESTSQNTGIGPELLFSSNNTFIISKNQVHFEFLASKSFTVNKPDGQHYDQKLTGNLGDDFEAIWGKISELGSAVSSLINPPSDARLKNISGDNTAGLKEINALEIKNFTFKADKNKTPHVGVIAQQLQKVFPNSVFKGEDGYLRINKDEIFYAMVNSIKELFKQIQDLTAKITGLDKRITALEKQNAQLKKQNAEFEKRLSRLERASK